MKISRLDINYTLPKEAIFSNFTEIISSSYHYDALGNLIEDDAEGIEVDWNVIGKVRNVLTPNNRLNFAYNPFGQRQIKRTDNDSTYYVHDATGNVMGIYVKDDLTLTAKERPIYGSSRLGIMNKAVVFNMSGGLVSKSNSTIGIKEYELSDHLGNVSVVVLDRKSYDGTNFYPYFKSMSDYYPFGYPISTRTFSIEPYRYGFNGQEGDNEVYGDGKSYTAEYWQYDSRLGRRWNVDPVIKPSLSSFSTFANNPISFKDFYGLDSIFYKKDGSYEIRKGGKEWYIHGELAEFVVRDVYNPYTIGSIPWRAVENNRNNPNLRKNRSKFNFYPSTSPWQKDFNKAFGWMINTTILGVALPELGGDLLGFSIEATPEIMGSIKTGTAFVKYQSARAAIFGGKIYNVVNYNMVYIGSYYSTGLIMGGRIVTVAPIYFGISYGFILNPFDIFTKDFESGNPYFDTSVQIGQFLHYLIKKTIDDINENKNEKEQKNSNN